MSRSVRKAWDFSHYAVRILGNDEAEESIILFLFYNVKISIVEENLEGRERGLGAGRPGGRRNSE